MEGAIGEQTEQKDPLKFNDQRQIQTEVMDPNYRKSRKNGSTDQLQFDREQSTFKHKVSKKQDNEKGLADAWGDYLNALGKHDKRKKKSNNE